MKPNRRVGRLIANRAQRLGFSLIELMISIAISSTIALVTGDIIVNAMLTMQTANNNVAGSSLVENIRTELADPIYARTPFTNPQNGQPIKDSFGQPEMVGCTQSFKFDMANPALSGSVQTLFNDLNKQTCAPVNITLTRSGGGTISAEVNANTQTTNANHTAAGYTYVKALQYCNAESVEIDQSKEVYTGELFITQNMSNSLGSIANTVMGAKYGPREYVSRVVVGVDMATGAIDTCDAEANLQFNQQNCQASAGLYFDPYTGRCQKIMGGTQTVHTCQPLKEEMTFAAGTNQTICAPIDDACSTSGSTGGLGTVAGGYQDGKMICNRPREVMAGSIAANPDLTTPIYTSFYSPSVTVSSVTQDAIATGGITNTSGTTVFGSTNATVNTSSISPIPPQCQSSLNNYLMCASAYARSKLLGGLGTQLPNCNKLQYGVCPSTVPVTNAGWGANMVGNQVLPPNATPPTNSCMCGNRAIPAGSYCGFCSLNIDPGFGSFENIQSVDHCQYDANLQDAYLVPVASPTIIAGDMTTQYCSSAALNANGNINTPQVYPRRQMIQVGPNSFQFQ